MPTLDRLIDLIMVWTTRGGLAWFIAHEYTSALNDKFDVVARALSKL
jgi:hypothetical protein